MSHTLTLRLPDELGQRLDRLVETTGRSKSYIVRSLIEESIGELEYVAKIEAYALAIHRGEVETQPMDELARELGFDPDELRAEAAAEYATNATS